MSQPYPQEIRRVAGDDLGPGTPAPGSPGDPEATARDGGPGTGLVVAAPASPGDHIRNDVEPGTASGSDDRTEVIEGYVVDLACLRRYPHQQYTERAAHHTTECGLMGHCVESGYGIVGEDNQLIPLDTESTPHVVAALQSAADTGVRLRVERVDVDGEMQTRSASTI